MTSIKPNKTWSQLKTRLKAKNQTRTEDRFSAVGQSMNREHTSWVTIPALLNWHTRENILNPIYTKPVSLSNYGLALAINVRLDIENECMANLTIWFKMRQKSTSVQHFIVLFFAFNPPQRHLTPGQQWNTSSSSVKSSSSADGMTQHSSNVWVIS